MFLIESFSHKDLNNVLKAVIYTGDICADPEWIASLAHKPYLRSYLASTDHSRPLDNVYLDTSAALSQREVLTRRQAVSETMQLMQQFPPHVKFFINMWTLGYETFIQAVYKTFEERIHVDRYKYDQFQGIFGPKAKQMFTRNPCRSKFHACDRHWKCDPAWQQGRGCFIFPQQEQAVMTFTDQRNYKMKRNAGCDCVVQQTLQCKGEECSHQASDTSHVVYVNPAEPFSRKRWAHYSEEMMVKLKSAQTTQEWPTNLVSLSLDLANAQMA